MFNYNMDNGNALVTSCDTCEGTNTTRTRERGLCRCRKALCTGWIIGILVALLTAAIGILVGVTYAESIIPAFAAIIVFAVVVAVLIVLTLIYYYCTTRRCGCNTDECCE